MFILWYEFIIYNPLFQNLHLVMCYSLACVGVTFIAEVIYNNLIQSYSGGEVSGPKPLCVSCPEGEFSCDQCGSL